MQISGLPTKAVLINISVMKIQFVQVYTVVTSTNCILLHVEYSALVQCWGTFPDISHPIITVIHAFNITVQTQENESQSR